MSVKVALCDTSRVLA